MSFELSTKETAGRPAVSVMIPVYNPSDYFGEALKSVLAQDMGHERMQIAVVDDASPKVDVAALLKEVAPGRIELHRNSHNLGLAGNWNECIRLARGRVVHVLHQDDWVADGFYARMLPAFEKHLDVGMAFCRHAYVDAATGGRHETRRERLFAGRLNNWLEKITEKQRIQCASVLVRRSVYEALGVYRDDLVYALDWEMWVRIAAHHAVWFEPRLMAFYRRHSDNETARLAAAGKVLSDELAAIRIFSEHLPPQLRERLVARAHAKIDSRQKRLQRRS